MVSLLSLLPSNSTRFERAVEQVSSERWDGVDTNIIRHFKDPWKCPAHLLNFLAYERSIDIWDENWPVERKRYVIANAFPLHALKGTLAGIERFIELSGAELLRSVVPPAKTFLMPTMTEDERQGWLSRFPQLRVYPFVEREHGKFKTFTTAANGRSKHFIGDGFPYDCAAYSRFGRRAKLFEPKDGTLTDLTVKVTRFHDFEGKAVQIEQVVLPGKPSRSFFLNGGAKANIYLVRSNTVERRVVSLETPTNYRYRVGQVQRKTVNPGWEPITVHPEGVAEKGGRSNAQTFPSKKEILYKKFLPPSTSWQRIYERTFLHDPSRLPDNRPKGVYLGYTRLGMPPYNSELKVAIRGKLPKSAVSRYCHGHFIEASRQPLTKVLRGVSASKSARDRILIDTKTKRSVTAGDLAKVGDLRVGELISA